jgi:hypothetical protein
LPRIKIRRWRLMPVVEMNVARPSAASGASL